MKKQEVGSNPGTSHHSVLVDGLNRKKKERPKTFSFVKHIRLMMHGFGDVSEPLYETAQMMNNIVYEEIASILSLSADISKQRCSTKISIAEIMFLLKGNIPRLFHYMRQLSVRDSKYEIPVKDDSDSDEGEIIKLTLDAVPMRRRKTSLQFLKLMDPLSSLVKSYRNGEFDEIRIKRLHFAELLTRDMDLNDYKRFSMCRCMSFTKHLALFQKWISKELIKLNIKLNKFGWESLAYLAYETVGLIVHFAVLIQAEQYAGTHANNKQVSDVLDFYIENSCKNDRQAITPKLVNEVLRRCYSKSRPQFNFTGSNKFKNSYIRSPCPLILR